MIRSLPMALLALAVLAACSRGTPPPPIGPAPVPAETAKMLCDVTGLAEERNSTLSMVGNSRSALRGQMNETVNGETILFEKLNDYEAEIEVAYRNVTSSCQLYARCLEGNGNDESRCLRSEARWDDAATRFADLSTAIRTIDAEVAKLEIEAKRDVEITKAKRPIIVKKPPEPCRDGCCGTDCRPACAAPCTDGCERGCAPPAPAPKPGCGTACKTVQGIFTTGCCE